MRIGVLFVALVLLQACGLLLGAPYRREQEVLVVERPPGAEPVSTGYAADATAVFDAQRVAAVAYVRLTRIRYCRGYSEEVVDVSAVEGRSLSTPGLMLDGGVLAAGVAGALVIPDTTARATLLAVASVPLAVDGISRLAKTEHPAERKVQRRYASGADAVFHCGATAETQVALLHEGRPHRAVEGVYPVSVSEAVLAAQAAGGPLELAVTVAGSVGAQGQTLRLTLQPEGPYHAFLQARSDALRYVTPLRAAKYMLAYPNSSLTGRLRGTLLQLLPAAQNADELQAVLALEGLDGELRRAVRERFTALRTADLWAELPVKLHSALAAERNANTFFLNGFAEDGRKLLAEKETLVAEACRILAELEARDGRPRDELLEAAAGKLDAKGAPALAWLKSCGARAP